MDNINLGSSYPLYQTQQTAVTDNSHAAEAENAKDTQENVAAVYKKSNEAEQTANATLNKANAQISLEKLRADAEERTQALRTLVEKLISKQSTAYGIATTVAEGGLAAFYRGLEVDEETRVQAQKDIAEDGYWGVEQTSDRILSFAKGLAGDDPKLAADMLEAVKKGFGLAEDEWGEELPELSKKTMEATYSKLNDWISSLNKTEVADEKL